jgi:glycosyltransferase involved in cell wall biosynthesis
MRVLFFGTYDARRHPRVRVLQQGLAARGDEIVECNVPLGVDTAQRVSALRRPWTAPRVASRVLASWRTLRARAKGVERPDAVVVGYMGHFDVHLAARLFEGVPIVLDHLTSAKDTAVDRGVRSRALIAALDQVDRRALSRSTVPCVDTEENLSLLTPGDRSRAIVVQVGAPDEWFRVPEPPGVELRVIFFGLYTPLQGAPVIARALAELARRGVPVRSTMVGSGQDFETVRGIAGAIETIEWLPWVEPRDLPTLVTRHDVCLGIFGTGSKALRVVPNKVFQGAAAGCTIVTSDTAPQRRVLSEAAVFVSPGDPIGLADALEGLAGDPRRTASLRVAAHELAERSFRPARIVEPLRSRLQNEIGDR